MLVGISGSLGSGKLTAARYLQESAGFTILHLPLDSDFANDPDFAELSSLLPENQSDSNSKDSKKDLYFDTVDLLLDYATCHWLEPFVLTPIPLAALPILQTRPFFFHLTLSAPLLTRFQAFSGYSHNDNNDNNDGGKEDSPVVPSALEILNLVAHSDAYDTKYAPLHLRADLHMSCVTPAKLDALDLACTAANANPDRLRPSWDAYFMSLSELAALRSNCMKRRVGCVLVANNRVVSTGYNGTPSGLTNCNEGGCARCNGGSSTTKISTSTVGETSSSVVVSGLGKSLDTCLCLHAEENALLEAGRARMPSGTTTLYCNTCPCLTCSVKIVQCGISEVVYLREYSMDHISHSVLKNGGTRVRRFHHDPDLKYVA